MRPVLLSILVALVGLAGCASDEPTVEEPTAGGATTDAEGSDAEGSDAEGSDAEGSDAEGSDAEGSDAAVDGDTTADDASDGEATDDVDELEFVRCESDDIDVDYPASWTAYDGEDSPPCRVFHPEPIDEFVGEDLHHAVRLHIDPVEFADATDSSVGEELSREETTVDGHDAVVTERRSEGEALIPEGERTYAYTVDLDGLILVGSTTTVGDTDYERDKQVLDRMMETLTVDVDDG